MMGVIDMEALLLEIRDDVKQLRLGQTELLVNDGRKHERIKSLESTRKWAFGILGTIIAAAVIAVIGVFI